MGIKDAWIAPGGTSPPWLLGGTGSSKLSMLGATQGELVDDDQKLGQAVAARFPDRCDATCLPYIGNDRLMRQGPGETDAAFRLRLQSAFPEWQEHSGNAWGILRQLRYQLLPSAPAMLTVSNTSVWDSYIDGANVDGPPDHRLVSISPNWNWDTTFDASPPGIVPWWRWWVVISSTDTNWATTGATWGDGTLWGDTNKSWGFSKPPSTFAPLKDVVSTWKAEGSWCRWIVVSFSNALFRPQNAAGAPNPDGTWGRWSKIVNRQYVPSRNALGRYIDGAA